MINENELFNTDVKFLLRFLSKKLRIWPHIFFSKFNFKWMQTLESSTVELSYNSYCIFLKLKPYRTKIKHFITIFIKIYCGSIRCTVLSYNHIKPKTSVFIFIVLWNFFLNVKSFLRFFDKNLKTKKIPIITSHRSFQRSITFPNGHFLHTWKSKNRMFQRKLCIYTDVDEKVVW